MLDGHQICFEMVPVGPIIKYSTFLDLAPGQVLGELGSTDQRRCYRLLQDVL
jgi:hypothetical protein